METVFGLTFEDMALRMFPNEIPVPARIATDGWEEIIDWCTARYGAHAMRLETSYERLVLVCERQGVPVPIWVAYMGSFYFLHPDHAFEFKMRWG